MELCQSLSCWSSLCIPVYRFPPSVGKVPWWVWLPGASHSLTFDCHGDTHLHSIILSLFYLSIHFLGEPSASVVRAAQTGEGAALGHTDQLPVTAAHGAQLRSCRAGLVLAHHNTPEPQAAAQKPHISPSWHRSAAAVVSQRVMRE